MEEGEAEEDEEREELEEHGARFGLLLLWPACVGAHAGGAESAWAERRAEHWSYKMIVVSIRRQH